MTLKTDYRKLNDGSIDYAHYITKSHAIRSKEAHCFIARIGNCIIVQLIRRFRSENTSNWKNTKDIRSDFSEEELHTKCPGFGQCLEKHVSVKK